MLNTIIVTILSGLFVGITWIINQKFSIFSPTRSNAENAQADVQPSGGEETDSSTDLAEDGADEAPNEENHKKKERRIPILIYYFALYCVFVCCGLRIIGDVLNYYAFAKLFLLLLLIVIAAFFDFKKRIIPNKVILTGFGIRLVVYLLEAIFCETPFSRIIINDLIGFGIGFGVLLIAALISKGAVGFGDVKLFGLIGIFTGTLCTYYTLLFSLVISAVISLILIAAKKKKRKDSIPFAPSVFLGYALVLLLTFY